MDMFLLFLYTVVGTVAVLGFFASIGPVTNWFINR